MMNDQILLYPGVFVWLLKILMWYILLFSAFLFHKKKCDIMLFMSSICPSAYNKCPNVTRRQYVFFFVFYVRNFFWEFFFEVPTYFSKKFFKEFFFPEIFFLRIFFCENILWGNIFSEIFFLGCFLIILFLGKLFFEKLFWKHYSGNFFRDLVFHKFFLGKFFWLHIFKSFYGEIFF